MVSVFRAPLQWVLRPIRSSLTCFCSPWCLAQELQRGYPRPLRLPRPAHHNSILITKPWRDHGR
jgi:hypothetical protein